MKSVLKLAMCLVVVAVSARMLMAARFVSTTQAPRPAGCHEHSNNVPAPAPVNYQCCQGGHDVAMAKALFVSQPMTDRSAGVVVPLSAPVAEFSVVSLPEISGEPPGSTPLRI